jgi:hypothetical protein
MLREQIDNKILRFLITLKENGWRVQLDLDKKGNAKEANPGKTLRVRYPNLPEDFLAFLSLVESCENKDNNVWFLTHRSYAGIPRNEIPWDFCESLSLEAAGGGADPEEVGDIKDYWDQYLPFLLSFKNGYAYMAIGTSGENFGQVIYGREPEFEWGGKICNSFLEFCDLYIGVLKGRIVMGDLFDYF